MRAQSVRELGEAQGEVNSMYSTPKSASAPAISTLSCEVNSAPTNCSPSRRVLSMMEKSVNGMLVSCKHFNHRLAYLFQFHLADDQRRQQAQHGVSGRERQHATCLQCLQ